MLNRRVLLSCVTASAVAGLMPQTAMAAIQDRRNALDRFVAQATDADLDYLARAASTIYDENYSMWAMRISTFGATAFMIAKSMARAQELPLSLEFLEASLYMDVLAAATRENGMPDRLANASRSLLSSVTGYVHGKRAVDQHRITHEQFEFPASYMRAGIFSLREAEPEEAVRQWVARTLHEGIVKQELVS